MPRNNKNQKIHEIKTKKTIQRNSESKSWIFRKIKQAQQTFDQLNKREKK